MSVGGYHRDPRDIYGQGPMLNASGNVTTVMPYIDPHKVKDWRNNCKHFPIPDMKRYWEIGRNIGSVVVEQGPYRMTLTIVSSYDIINS